MSLTAPAPDELERGRRLAGRRVRLLHGGSSALERARGPGGRQGGRVGCGLRPRRTGARPGRPRGGRGRPRRRAGRRSSRAAQASLPLAAVAGDATEIDDLAEAAGAALVIGPLQVAQLFDAEQREQMLAGISRCLAPGGVLRPGARGRVDAGRPRGSRGRPGPRHAGNRRVGLLERAALGPALRRDAADAPPAPAGLARRATSCEGSTTTSCTASRPRRSRHEAARAGLRPAGRRAVPANESEAGSVVVILEAP